MRTTLTLDEDVAAKLRAEVRRTGKTFRQTVNDHLRRGLMTRRPAEGGASFRIRPRDLGRLLPGLSLDNVGDLLERLEGLAHQ
jgi:hypothetical protein